MFRNVLIMDASRYQNTGGRADIFNSTHNIEFLDMVIVVNKSDTSFDVIKNRFGPCSTEVPLCFLAEYIEIHQLGEV